MTTETSLAVVDNEQDRARKVALLKAIGLDRQSPEVRELALAIAKRYELDLLLKHLVIIEGRPYITRDGLLHVAHRSQQLDGIVATEPEVVDKFWRASCSVYRKDMTHPFTYVGRYPTTGGNQKFAPEMAVKCAEVMALRRAFDVSLPTIEERWDVDMPDEPAPKPTLADRVAERASAVRQEMPVTDEAAAEGLVRGEAAAMEVLNVRATETCGDEDGSPMALGTCVLDAGHAGAHANAPVGDPQRATWPARKRTS